VNPLLRGAGLEGWFGWWTSPQSEALMQTWLDAADADAWVLAGRDLGGRAMDVVAIVPLGQWFGRTAYRRSITRVLPGGASCFWNVRPA
jgi:peptide/nickel transport system substrate-binding protein